jgi:hypothetical protein
MTQEQKAFEAGFAAGIEAAVQAVDNTWSGCGMLTDAIREQKAMAWLREREINCPEVHTILALIADLRSGLEACTASFKTLSCAVNKRRGG